MLTVRLCKALLLTLFSFWSFGFILLLRKKFLNLNCKFFAESWLETQKNGGDPISWGKKKKLHGNMFGLARSEANPSSAKMILYYKEPSS